MTLSIIFSTCAVSVLNAIHDYLFSANYSKMSNQF